MLVISSREFRDHQATYMDKVDNGEQVMIQRGKNKAYQLTLVSEDDLYFSAEMIVRIKESIEQIKAGKTTKLGSTEELLKFFNSL